MKIVILDVYFSQGARMCKDTNGGYGTVNDYGSGFVAKALTRIKKNSSNWPPLYSVYTAGILRKNEHKVEYIKIVGIDKLNSLS